jgi:site-specific DNA recombinase
MASPALIPKKLNVDIDAILATLQVPVVSDADYIGLAALYIRVSTADQGERYSLPSQLRLLLVKAARDGYRVRRDHIFVDAHTGKLASRPDFDRMRALVKTRALQAVLIYTQDRFARKTLDSLTLLAEFKRYGTILDFVETPFEDTAIGRFTFTQLAAVSELIGEKILTDSKRGRDDMMDDGWLPHRSPPYGFKCLSKRDVLNGLSRPRWIVENGKRVAAPANERHPQLLLLGDAKMEAAIHRAYTLADKGRTIYSIVDEFNDAGILTAGKPGQYEPGTWGPVAMKQLLSNPTYIGKHKCSGREFLCDQLVDEALFRRVQAKMEMTKAAYVGRPATKNFYLLRGLLWCGECRRRWITNPGLKPSGNRYPIYLCGNIEYKPYKRLCSIPPIHCEVFERVVWDAIWGDVLVPERLLKMAEAYYAAIEQPDSAVNRKAERELAKLMTGLKNVERALADGNMEYTTEVSADMKAKKARIAALTAEAGSARRVSPLPPYHLA